MMRFCLASILGTSLIFCFAARAQGQGTSGSASEYFLIDHNRIFVELEFVRPDGTLRKALAFVDNGDPAFEFTSGLVKELGLEKDNPVRVRFAGMDLNVNPKIDASAY